MGNKSAALPWALIGAACLGSFATTSSGTTRAPFLLAMSTDLDVSMPLVANLVSLTATAWGIVSDLLSFFARKPAYWYKGSVIAMTAVTVLSAVVYGHHMFVTGMNPLLGQGFMLLTLIISVPAEVLFLNWMRTMWRGSLRLPTPMLFALGMLFVFGVGGLTGLYLGDQMHGEWAWYRRDGSLMRTGAFDRGKQIGIWRTYDRAGRLVKETLFESSRPST